MINRYAVMGNPVSHSLSPVIHQLFAKQTGRVLSYEKILVDESRFEQQVEAFFNQGGKGLNITLPCKQRAFAIADHASDRCTRAKAANTLWRDAGGLQADNTDGAGLLRDLARYIHLTGKRVLLLGAGGAARGVAGPLLAASPSELVIANRTPDKAASLSRDFFPASSCSLTGLSGTFDLVINATSSSLADETISLPATLLSSTAFCYDLAYNQLSATPFVTWAHRQGCAAVDGLGMLVEQAAEAFFIWHGVMPDVEPVLDELRKA